MQELIQAMVAWNLPGLRQANKHGQNRYQSRQETFLRMELAISNHP